jgi:hypothetical protein
MGKTGIFFGCLTLTGFAQTRQAADSLVYHASAISHFAI